MLRINSKMEEHNKKVHAHKTKWKLRYTLLATHPQTSLFQLFQPTPPLTLALKKRSTSARSLNPHARPKDKPPRPKTCHSARNYVLKPQDFVFPQQRQRSVSLEKPQRQGKCNVYQKQNEHFERNYQEMLLTLQQFAAQEAVYFTKNSFKPLVPKRRYQPKLSLQKKSFPDPPLRKHLQQFNYQGLVLHNAKQLPKWFYDVIVQTPRHYPQNLLSSKVLQEINWCFKQECDMILLDKESLRFYRIPNVRSRGGKLVVWLDDQPALHLDLLDLYKKLNHILYFEEEGTISPFFYCCIGNGSQLQFQMFLFDGRQNRPLHRTLLREFYERVTLMRVGCEMPRRESAQLSLDDQRILQGFSRRLLKKRKVLLLNQLGHAQQFELSDVLWD